MEAVFRCLTIVGLIASSTGVFIYTDNPYNGTKIKSSWFMVNVLFDKSPLHSSVFYPTVPGDYSVYFFVPGANGFVEGELYLEYLSRVAEHGFIVISTDLIWPAVTTRSAELAKTQSEKYLAQYSWMKDNLQSRITERAPGVNIAWYVTSVGSHSSGADVTLKMLESNSTLFSATVFLEPFSFNLHKTVPFSTPALMYGTELMEKHVLGFPPCSIKGMDYQHFYDNWRPLKVLLQVKKYGHCDILDKFPGWEACHASHVCATNKNTNLDQYKDFIAGLTSAFLVSTALEYNTSIAYVIDGSRVPADYMKLQYVLKPTGQVLEQ